MKVTVSRQELAAALLFASEDDTRYVITGVLVCGKKGGPPLLVSTDGRRLAVIESIASQEESEGDGSFVLRAEFIRPLVSLCKAFGGKEFPWMTLAATNPGTKVEVKHVGGFFEFSCREQATIEAEYPNWKQCVPAKNKRRVPVTDLALNASYVGDFAKAAKLLGASSPVVQMSMVGEDGAVEVHINGLANFYGVIMKCAADTEVEYQPEFVSIVNGFPAKPDAEEVDELEDEEEGGGL